MDVILFGCVAVAAVLVYRLFDRRHKTLRALARVPVSSIGDAKDGMAIRVVGRLGLVGEPLVAPVSQRRCAYFEVHLDEAAAEGKRERILREAEGQDFILRDDTGKALVRFEAGDRLPPRKPKQIQSLDPQARRHSVALRNCSSQLSVRALVPSTS